MIVVIGIGITVGVLAMRGARAPLCPHCVIGLLGSFAVLTRPDPTLGKLLPTIVGTACPLPCCGTWRHDRPAPRP